jgi:hypothetical protein
MGYSSSPQGLFSLLPKTRTPWREFVYSTGVQACVIAFLLWLRLLQPTVISTPEHSFRSVRLTSTPAPVNHEPQPVRQLPEPVYVANADPPANALRLPSPQAKAARIEDTPAPTVSIAPQRPEPLAMNAPPVTPKIVATNLFSAGSSAGPTVARAPEQVQTGGFGDPNGVPAKGDSGKAANIAAVGSFDSPSANWRNSGRASHRFWRRRGSAATHSAGSSGSDLNTCVAGGDYFETNSDIYRRGSQPADTRRGFARGCSRSFRQLAHRASCARPGARPRRQRSQGSPTDSL